MRMYLAGGESMIRTYKLAVPGEANLFASYFYTSNATKFLEHMRQYPRTKGFITIDSGAHSFFGLQGMSCTSGKTPLSVEKPDEEKYFAAYCDWLEKYWSDINYFVELDIQSIIGIERVRAWRQVLKDRGLFSKCIMVHHSSDPPGHFEELLETSESRYIGFEGKRERKILLDYMPLLKRCYEAKIRVHGFALTSRDVVSKYPFFSVDSTTWANTTRYGMVISRDAMGFMKPMPGTKKNFVKHNFPTEWIGTGKGRDTTAEILKYHIEQNLEIEAYMTRLWEQRGIKWE